MRTKNSVLIVALFVMSVAGAAGSAQAQALGYGLAGVSGYTGWFGGGLGWHAAGGGEVLAKGVAGAAAELGVLGNGSGGLWVASFNGVGHMPAIGDGTSAYFTGGYSRFSNGEGSFNAINFGVGADFRSAGHVGTRVEFRDHLRRDFRGKVHYVSIRAGIVFK
ncbi:MAG TPA: hypothetical protein VL243_06970 [Vicinamibacterales bacterium]|nr:hypothetical protein [Vicinamibacterales bacterium]